MQGLGQFIFARRYTPLVVKIDVVAGVWRQILKKDIVTIQPVKFFGLNDKQERALAKAARAYLKFLDKKLILPS